MKIIKNQYFFFILLSALLLILGISFSFIKDNKSDARVMSAHAKIELCLTYTEKWNVNESYGGYTIYAPSPTLKVVSGTYNTSYPDNMSPWITAVADTGTPDTGVLYSGDATSWNKGYGTISYTLNSNYNASIKLTGPNGATRTSTGGLVDDSGTYTGTMSVTIKTAEKVNCYHKTTASGSYSCYKSSTEELYGSANVDWYDYSTPTGMHMNGWYVNSTSGTLVEGYHTPRIYTKGENNFYMNYSYNEYTIKFNGNGHTYGSTSNKSCVYESSFTMPQNGFTKVGYKFLSWNTKADGTGTTYYSGTAYKNLTSTNNGSITLYAQWQKINYTVKFNANGGTAGSMANQSFTYDVSQTLTANAFTRVGSGLCYNNWDIDYASTVNFNESTGINSSGVYYSESGYYTHLEMIPFTNTSGSSVTLTSNYTICGIYAYNSSGGFIKRCSNYATTHSIPSGTYYIRIEMNVSDLPYASRGELRVWGSLSSNTVKNLTATDGKTVNLYVHWVKEQYTILYYATQDIYTSGGNAMSSATVTYGASYTFPIPTRTGYLFDGWKHATTSEIYNGSKTIPDWGNDGKTKTIINVPLYATWTPITYKINFDANTGSGSMESMSKTFDTPKRLSSNRFTKEGYNFVGWSLDPQTPYTCEDTIWQETLTNANWSRMSLYTIQNTVWTQSYSSNPSMGGDIYFVTGSDTDDGTFTSLINSHGDEITIYAVWEAVDYEIVFDGNGSTGGSMSNLAMIYDVSKTLTSNTYTRDGYLFLGWHRDKDSTEKEYNNIQSVKNVQLYDEENKTYRTVVEGDKVKLYAVWKETWAIHNEKPNGSGTVADPYLISTPQELAWISYMYETATAFDNSNLTPYFLQTANIDLSEYEWLPIADSTNPFGGTYDGNGYVIKNIQTYLIPNVTRAQIGLFGFSNAGTIKNVRLFGDIKGNTNVGGILGYGANVTIENCTNNALITATTQAGGIVGNVRGGSNIISCYNYKDVTARIAGGIAGMTQGVSSAYLNISKCYATGIITGVYTGGFIGGDNGYTTISQSAFEGRADGTKSGAFIGHVTSAIITNCYAKGYAQTTTNYGLYGEKQTSISITNCIFDVNDFSGYVGSDFSQWIISSDNRVLPSGLSWLAIGGTKVINISQISGKYTKVG